jgi:hypothetical protein
MTGIVVAVSRSATHTMSKSNQDSIRLVTIRFPAERPLPAVLVAKVVKARIFTAKFRAIYCGFTDQGVMAADR